MSAIPKKKEDYVWQKMFGAIQPLLEDPSVTEVMVNGAFKVYIEQKGLIKKTPIKFKDNKELLEILLQFAQSMGKHLSRRHPTLDSRLPDGSRVNIVIPPVAVDGPSLTIRKFSPFSLNHEHLINSGMLDERMAYFLSCCVQAKMNLLVCGGTGSGKTTLLNVLSSFIPSHERIVTIEDAAELKIKNENTVRLESRAPQENDPGITIRQLVINALRMRPDRIVVGECRGPEAMDMLFAMNTGHEGSMSTLHANSCREALRRLEGMIMLAGIDIPLKVIREHMSSALNVLVNVQRFQDGSRKITEIVEVGRMEEDVILTQEIFKYDHESGFQSMGFVPRFIHLFERRGVKFPKDFFTDTYQVRGRQTIEKSKSKQILKK